MNTLTQNAAIATAVGYHGTRRGLYRLIRASGLTVSYQTVLRQVERGWLDREIALAIASAHPDLTPAALMAVDAQFLSGGVDPA